MSTLAEKADGARTDRGSAESSPAGRTVVLVSPDGAQRQRLAEVLRQARWLVREARGGAQAMLHLELKPSATMVIDSWLPDLEVHEFAAHMRLMFPRMELLRFDGATDAAYSAEDREAALASGRGALRDELLHAIHAACGETREQHIWTDLTSAAVLRTAEAFRVGADGTVTDGSLPPEHRWTRHWRDKQFDSLPGDRLPELVGSCAAMREVAQLVRMVAPRTTPVLIEGETGTGKELVARALHLLGLRAAKPFVVLNCAAIPESLLEAELFGHARGAFTGAVRSRMGRIASANGGTLLLDEIGEMPVAMQAKMLRFIESGELQKVGENEVMRVDVRLIAATHQPLEQRSAEGLFRLDLYHRLAVFPIEVPPLRERGDDIVELATHFLAKMGMDGPRKRLSAAALERLRQHTWPGNVRELMHVLERGAILAGAHPEIGMAEIRYRRRPRVS